MVLFASALTIKWHRIYPSSMRVLLAKIWQYKLPWLATESCEFVVRDSKIKLD